MPARLNARPNGFIRAGRQDGDISYLMLNTGYLILDTGYWILDTGYFLPFKNLFPADPFSNLFCQYQLTDRYGR